MTKKILFLLFVVVMIFSLILSGCGGSEAVEETAGEEAIEEEAVEDVVEEEAVEEKAEVVEGEALEIQEGKVTFTTVDDIVISGNIFGTGKKWVILTHKLQADQASWFDFADILVENGYTALTYDIRGIGRSGGSMYNKEEGIVNSYMDLEAAIAFVRQHNPEKIFLMGSVTGGTQSLKVASKEPVDGVISISGPEEFGGLSVIDEIADVTPPKLFIASSSDKNAAESANNLYANSPEPKEIKILEGGGHGLSVLKNEPENGVTVEQIILDFLNNN